MAVHIYLTPGDLAQVRFGFSPLVELSISFKLLMHAGTDARYRRWLDETRRALYGTEFPYLTGLMEPGRYIPDFLTPTPLTTDLTFDEEMERLLALPDEVIRANIQQLLQHGAASEVIDHFLMYPRDALHCLVEDLRLYWQRALERHWARITDVLDDDIIYRAKKMALGGIHDLFVDLHPKIHYATGELQLDKAPHDGVTEYHLRGDGLQLVPSSFAFSRMMYQIESKWQPMLIYTSRGTGLWWKEKPATPDPSLEIVMGAGRARVFQALMTPTSTGDLARKIGLTAGATSQHLSRLHQAGLVTSRRNGKRVYYHLTTKGEHLLALFDGEYQQVNQHS